MKKKITLSEIFNLYWKWILPAAYVLTIAFWGWPNRNALFDLIPINENSIPFYGVYMKVLDVLFILVALLFLVGLVKVIRTPIFLRARFQKAFERIGLHNSLKEYPVLISCRRNRYKPHGFIYEINNVGISILEFDNKVAQLEAALHIVVNEFDFGNRKSRILIYATPRKHVKPMPISINERHLSRAMINCLCVGKTGSGKSYALSVLLGIFANSIPDVSITICDYKKSSFAQFADTPNFYGYEDVPDGIRAFYNEFAARLEANDEERNKQIKVLLIDEYGALIAAQEKKIGDELKAMVANMLFMSRSLGMRVLIGVQRADSEHFKAGARDQFRAILAMGNLSKEQKQMLFSEHKDKMTDRNGLGEGYLLIDGQNIERVKIEPIEDVEALNESIRKAMCR
jgi:hypothetical protein